MTLLQIVYAPNAIFQQIAQPVKEVDHNVRQLVDNMFHTMAFEKAVGMGANMVGILQRIVVIDLRENNVSKPFCLINPEITWRSDQNQTFEEAFLCFPSIAAPISRPNAIKVKYLDYDGKTQESSFEGFPATVIQHEMDYLDGKVFLDYLSKMKRDMLIKKMQKYIKSHQPHVHGAGCNH
ncbi:MAG: peptide deformylase [Alphaproteobacteria bacterium]